MKHHNKTTTNPNLESLRLLQKDIRNVLGSDQWGGRLSIQPSILFLALQPMRKYVSLATFCNPFSWHLPLQDPCHLCLIHPSSCFEFIILIPYSCADQHKCSEYSYHMQTAFDSAQNTAATAIYCNISFKKSVIFKKTVCKKGARELICENVTLLLVLLTS